MLNTLYHLIEDNDQTIFQTKFDLSMKKSKNNKKYIILEPKKIQEKHIKVNKQLYQLKSCHFSIYEDLKVKKGEFETYYHLTCYLLNEHNNKITARIYFSNLNKILHISFKDENNNTLHLDSQSLLLNIKGHVDIFSNLFYTIYTNKNEIFQNKYQKLINQLNRKSIDLSDNNPQSYQTYLSSLDNLLNHLNDWKKFDLFKKLNFIKYYLHLKEKIHNEKLAKSNYLLENNKDIDSVEKKWSLENIKKASQNDVTEIEKEYNFLIKKLEYYENFKDDENGHEILDTISSLKEIETGAYYLTSKLIITSSNDQEKIQKALEVLIKIIPSVQINLASICIINNNLKALQLLIEHHPELNINQLIPNREIRCLELAYQMKCISIFRFLLEAGAFYDFQNEDGNTLLMQAFREPDRNEETKLLLQAGASATLRGKNGLTAFGQYVMNKDKKPTTEKIDFFLKNCTSYDIDYMQGPENFRATPLSFACQENWTDVASYLLQHGADPACVREGDIVNALNLSIGKGYYEMCKIILKESQYSLGRLIHQAEIYATAYKKYEINQLIKTYKRENSKSLEPDDKGFYTKLAVGASTTRIEGIKNSQRLSPQTNAIEWAFFKSPIVFSGEKVQQQNEPYQGSLMKPQEFYRIKF